MKTLYLILAMAVGALAYPFDVMPTYMAPPSVESGTINPDTVNARAGHFHDLFVDSLWDTAYFNPIWIDNGGLLEKVDGNVVGLSCAVGEVPVASTAGSLNYAAAASNGTRIVAVKTNGTSVYTDDGTTLTPGSSSLGTRDLAFVNSLWLSLGGSGSLQTSTTGLAGSWTTRTSGLATNLNSAVYTGSRFLVAGASGNTATSPTGVTWSTSTVGAAIQVRGLVADGVNTVVAVGDISGGSAMIRTTDSTTSAWTARTSGVNKTLWDGIFAGSQFVVTGDSGIILTSPTGVTWTLRTSGVVTPLYGIAHNGTVYAVVGAGGVIQTSTNGTAWTTRTSGTADDLNAIVTRGTTFYAFGNNGVFLSSSDNGVTWTSAISPQYACLNKDSIVAQYRGSVSMDSGFFRTIRVSTGVSALTAITGTTATLTAAAPLILGASTATVQGDGTGDRIIIAGGSAGAGGTGGGGILVSGSTQAVPGEVRLLMGLGGQFRILDSADNVVASVLGNLNRKFRTNYGLVVTGGNFRQTRQTFSDADAQVDSNASIVAQIGTMGASRTLTLPTAASYGSGILNISDESGSVTGGNTIVITRSGSDLINGANTTTINAAYGARILVSDGVSKWTILSSL